MSATISYASTSDGSLIIKKTNLIHMIKED